MKRQQPLRVDLKLNLNTTYFVALSPYDEAYLLSLVVFMPKNFSYQKERQVAITVALRAGELLREKFAILLKTSCNGKLLPDLGLSEVNQLILGLIQTEFPNDLIMGCSDQNFCSDGEHLGKTWLIKPHDGEHGFYTGHRNTAVSIALLDREELVLGVDTALVGADLDDDGVTNGADICPNTLDGVPVKTATGCSIEQLCPCETPMGTTTRWRNHGKYVSCTSKTSKSFVEEAHVTTVILT